MKGMRHWRLNVCNGQFWEEGFFFSLKGLLRFFNLRQSKKTKKSTCSRFYLISDLNWAANLSHFHLTSRTCWHLMTLTFHSETNQCYWLRAELLNAATATQQHADLSGAFRRLCAVDVHVQYYSTSWIRFGCLWCCVLHIVDEIKCHSVPKAKLS